MFSGLEAEGMRIPESRFLLTILYERRLPRPLYEISETCTTVPI